MWSGPKTLVHPFQQTPKRRAFQRSSGVVRTERSSTPLGESSTTPDGATAGHSYQAS